ncbi:DUF4240 domain-containing protein [Streptacidiphilus sp. EB103A]|uniref:DUF4240 domain-containing protein n=1 Tax=Streptacidiphilus sp. EB103A TaxID=3156275 RepID=UPI0035139F13
MNVETFWELIELCRRQAKGRNARLAWLRTDLSRRTQEEIVEFQLCLDQLTRQAFTWELVAAAERIFGGRCSDDDFDYFGLWMVGLGGEVFGRAVLDPDALADAPEVLALTGRHWRAWGEDWPGWELLDYVASEAFGLVAGDADECGEDFYAAVQAQRGEQVASRGLAGEHWNVRDEVEAARRLPRLSAMFPLSDDS